MRVLVTGSTGLVGSALVASLQSAGHDVLRLVRDSPAAADESRWDPMAGEIDAAALDGIDAAVHLAGESLLGRWTAAKRERIRESRVRGTRLLSETLARLARPPKVLVSSSGVGYYGTRGDEVLTEDSAPGDLFLSEVCAAWEGATEPASAKGIRVVSARQGVILDTKGGALKAMLTPFRLGLGGRVGSGRQFFSWIALDDCVGAMEHALATESLRGPVIMASPQTATNADLTRALGRVLGRPTVVPLPAFAARLVFGQVADELLLASTRADSSLLVKSGYRFRHPDLEGALRHVLGKG